MRPVVLSKTALLGVLAEIKAGIERDDSFEGSIEYLMPEPLGLDGDFAVRASWRVGNSQGQGGVRMIGDTSEAS